MIVSMKKITFLVYHKEYRRFLEEIRQRGVVHVKEMGDTDGSGGALGEKLHIINRLNEAVKFLKRHVVTDTATKKSTGKADGLKVLHDIESLRHEHEVVEQNIQLLEKDEHQLKPWGSFEWETIERLREQGMEIQFFSCPTRKWETEWEKKYNAFEISRRGTSLYFVTVLKKGEEPDIEADPVRLPAHSIKWITSDKVKVEKQKAKIEEGYDKFATQYIDILEETKLKVKQEFDFENIETNSDREVDEKVVILEGFIPEAKEKEFLEYLDGQPVYYELRKPIEGDKVPVLLKNNRFARLFEPIGKLYSLPNYGEIDLTAFLAPFYLLFFGFCFSDAGYGLLFVAVATYFKRKVSDDNKPLITLIQLLGASTILFGILGGVFFGIELFKTNLPVYRELYQIMGEKGITVQDIMFKSSLVLGLIQILFGMFLRAFKLIKQSGIKYAVSTLGWAIGIVASVVNYFIVEKGIAEFSNVPYLVIATLCGIGILFYNTPGKNLFLNFGAGLWDAYNTVVGGVGDLLSYVRLFALGLASGILGLVFNDLASKIVNPDASTVGIVVTYIGMTLILIVGHAINIFMSGLGSLVHPLRLTFVEFYKNAGFEGGGKAYNPFRNQINK
jgi:V/A-type H+-transporting ATPase subunit I